MISFFSLLSSSKTAWQVATNTFAQLFGKLITMGTTLIVTALLARQLGDAGYGQFSLIMGYAAFFYIIVDGGLNAIVTREWSEKGDSPGSARLVGALLLVRGVMTAVIVCGAALAISFFPYSSLVKIGMLLALSTVLTQALITTGNGVFQVRLRYGLSVIGLTMGSVFLLVWMGGSWIFADPSLLYYVLGFSLQGVVFALITVWFAWRLLSTEFLRSAWGVSHEDIRALLLPSLPLILVMCFAQIHGKADLFLLSLLPSPDTVKLSRDEIVGQYGLAYKIFEVVLVFATFFMNAAYPVLVRLAAHNRERFLSSFRLVVLFLAGAGVLTTLIGYAFAPLAIRLAGGSDFTHATLILRLLLLGLPIFFVSSAYQWYLIAEKRQWVLPGIYAIAAVTTVGLNIYMIPRYSFVASAVITWGVEWLILALMGVYAYVALHNRREAF